MTQPSVCFSHGKESGPRGTKINALAGVARGRDWAIESLDYRGIDDPQQRVARLLEWCGLQTGPFVLVGSSMGGYVAAAAALQSKPSGLFLMAPAFYVPGYEGMTPQPPQCPVTIVHGWSDEIIPWANSVRFAEQCASRLMLLDSDHSLASVLPEISEHFGAFLDSMNP